MSDTESDRFSFLRSERVIPFSRESLARIYADVREQGRIAARLGPKPDSCPPFVDPEMTRAWLEGYAEVRYDRLVKRLTHFLDIWEERGVRRFFAFLGRREPELGAFAPEDEGELRGLLRSVANERERMKAGRNGR